LGNALPQWIEINRNLLKIHLLYPMSFNLLEESWIPVVSQDWQRRDVSLTELLSTWATLREIQADNPPTTLAIYRFLLAILHRAYNGPKHVDHWEEIQQDSGKGAIAYLEQWRDRFDLFHPKHPFMQDIAIEEKDAGEVYLASVLHGNNTSTVFCHEHQWSNAALAIPEAARLLLRLHNFDTGGRKTGATDSAAVLPLMDAANVLVRGQNLGETLLLNLMEYDPARDKPSVVTGDDLPAWERPYQKPKERIPAGYIDYLTYQWRRVKLFAEAGQVVKVALHPGDRVPKDVSTSQWECGIAYTKTKKGLMTVRLNLARSLWRDSAVFLQSAETSSRPRILDWVAILKAEKGLIQSDLHLQILGLNVDNAKPLGWSGLQFAAPLIYLTDKPLWQSLSRAIAIAEEHQQLFRAFRGSPYHALAEALNNHDAGSFAATLDGESRYWATLDRAFQEFLQALPTDKTDDGNGITYGNTQLPEWTKTVQKAARAAFTNSIAAIRNYEARAKALRALEWKLADLRASPEEKEAKKAKSAKKKEKIAK
jgi:CRISPR system Cascade subunit CasA